MTICCSEIEKHVIYDHSLFSGGAPDLWITIELLNHWASINLCLAFTFPREFNFLSRLLLSLRTAAFRMSCWSSRHRGIRVGILIVVLVDIKFVAWAGDGQLGLLESLALSGGFEAETSTLYPLWLLLHINIVIDGLLISCASAAFLCHSLIIALANAFRTR